MDIEKTINNLIKENRAKMGLGLSRYVLGTVILLGIVTGGLWLFFPAYTQFLTYFVVLILLGTAAGLYPVFYRRDQAKTGALILCCVMFSVITVALFSMPEIMPAGGIAYIAVMIIGKLLLGEKDSRWLNVAIVVALALVLIWGEQVAVYWFVPLPEMLGIIFNVVVSLGCLVAVILFLGLVVGGQEEQFRQAQRAGMELELAVQDYGNFMAKVAGGDLSSRLLLNGDTDSPLVKLGHSLNNMVNDLHNLVGQVQESADQVASASVQLNASADQAGQASQQVAATSQQVAEGTSRQTQSVTEASDNVEQMARAAEGIARGAQEQAQSVQKMSDLIEEMANEVDHIDGITGSITDTDQKSGTIRAQTAVAVEKVKEMGVRSKEIGRIVETIDEIADKTDMLALNAAVEAARAGEHGRGFAVVADQVRKLSEDSKGATRDINTLIERVQEAISEAVTSVEGTATLAGQISEAVTQLKQKSEGVVTTVETVSAVVEENTATAEEMAANSQDVSEAMEGVAGIAEENSAATEEVNASAEEMSAQIEEAVASAEELAALAEELRLAAARFRVNESKVNRTQADDGFDSVTTPVAAGDDHRGNGTVEIGAK